MKLISQSRMITGLLFCILMYSCDMTPPKNDAAMHITGQYYLTKDGKQMSPDGNVITLAQYYLYDIISYGSMIRYDNTKTLLSETNGTFDFQVEGMGDLWIDLMASYNDHDTILYLNDTILKGKQEFNDISIVLHPMHIFNPTLTKKGDPREICFAVGDTLIFSINHDALTRIQITRYRLDTATKECIEDTIADYRVDNSLTYEFVLPDTQSLPSEDDIIRERFRLHYTTLHYGSRISPWYGVRFNSHGQDNEHS